MCGAELKFVAGLYEARQGCKVAEEVWSAPRRLRPGRRDARLRRKSAKEHGLLVELGKGLRDDSKLDLRGEAALGVDVAGYCLMLKVDCIVKDYLATSKFPPGLEESVIR